MNFRNPELGEDLSGKLVVLEDFFPSMKCQPEDDDAGLDHLEGVFLVIEKSHHGAWLCFNKYGKLRMYSDDLLIVEE